jgi:hypothetical protein
LIRRLLREPLLHFLLLGALLFAAYGWLTPRIAHWCELRSVG